MFVLLRSCKRNVLNKAGRQGCMLTSPARAAVLYNRQGRVDCRGQGRPLLPGVRGLRMRRFVTRTQCSNTTQQDTRLWDGKGARAPPRDYVQYNHGTRVRPSHSPHCQTRLILTCLRVYRLFWIGPPLAFRNYKSDKKYHSLLLKKFR